MKRSSSAAQVAVLGVLLCDCSGDPAHPAARGRRRGRRDPPTPERRPRAGVRRGAPAGARRLRR